ncbi:EscU/YscU/HrcU family type III secretion system export apparatus switch protein [Planctomycetes bacterium TBK1r]|uniref:Flagellar biosynthetic protein FlhB n=1 Tax=Stieleria magnilauensis TaxID=2527963 RepID=A0ABX5XXC3_9BACT|nr:Flagellar biosynthetic protein FlhB [Planctomycetes bacterium TBK1r]
MAENQDRDQRTEEATPQRLRKAREDGQIGFSAELVGGVILATTAFFYWSLGDWFFGTLTGSIEHRMTEFEEVVVDPRLLVKAFIDETLRIGAAVMAIVAPLGILAAATGLLQTSFNLSFKPLELNVDKLSVIKGFQKIFSMQSAVRGALSLAKAAVIVAIAVFVGQSKIDQITTSGFGSIQELMFFLGGLLVQCSLAIAATITFIGMVDLGFQKWKHLEDMKMSRQDIKEEHKSSEGDPMVRARIKQLQAEMGRKRMLSDVPKASVVITNPTHFAVAVQYDRDNMEAPIVIAKGADFVAKKIIAIAKENGVPVVERKPVARFLFKNVEIGNAIPFELYQAVAEILNFVNRMRSAI